MKKKLMTIGLALAILFSIGLVNQAQPRTTIGFNSFFEALAPYGKWVSTPDYGYVWAPAGVGSGWHPYTDGHWVWSDYGWTWLSFEPWGWAPFHYGRWVYTDYYGWVWIPGTTWAPAWVTWYTGPNYIGWAPLIPDERFSLEVGISFSNYHYYTPREAVFVPSGSFLNARISDVVIPRSRNVMIINNTRNINNITIENNRVINRGPDVNFVERATRTRVQKVNLVDRGIDQRTIVKDGGNFNQIKGKDLYVYRPDLIKKGNETPIIKKNVEKSAIQNKYRNMRIQNEATTPYHQRHADEPNKEVRKEEKINNKNSSLNSNHNLGQYAIRWDGNRKGNSFVRESTVPSQHPDIHSENRHKVYRDTANSKQLQVPRNNKPYSHSQYTYTQKQYYQSNSNAKEQKIKNSDFRQRSTNNGNAESRRYQKQTDRNG